MDQTNGNQRRVFSMRSTAVMPPSPAPGGRTGMAKFIGRWLVAVMAVAAMTLAGVAGTGLAQAQTSTSTDREALVALYNATDGPNWRYKINWLSGRPLGWWNGVTTDSNGRVTHLELPRNDLSGGIPSELGDLSNLEVLYLNGNRLSGEMPSELGSLSNLERLDLDGNQLTGEIPSELGSLSNLERLDLGPAINLTHFSLDYNQLSGEIPPELGSLSNLEFLLLGGNQLSGEIPPELGNLSNLEVLYLNGNQLSGEVLPELGSLSNLEVLWLHDNQLSGEIPPELGSLSNLEALYLGGNQLSGEIPPELGSLSNLRGLYLYYNQLSGEIPPELGSLSNLEWMNLGGNQLSGEIPPELGSLSNLEVLWLDGNSSLSGPLPSSFTGLTSLNSLSLTATGLCAPTDAAFQAWLGRIGDRRGVVDCAADQAGTVTLSTMRPVVGAQVTAMLDDPDGAVTGMMWQWARSLDGTTGWADIAGATSMSYTPAPMDDGYYLRATATYTDPLASGRTAVEVSDHPVTAGDPLVARYDANGNNMIDKVEVIAAINDYLFGEGDASISKGDVIKLINLYLFG